ncbi:hypothetical protein HYX12_00945 [Candidatus Woesearchaeota archaeon]|nr:hypothetical protein [Candidatus Woesearchaeota archaeon]
MSLLEKLKFWRREDSLDFDELAQRDMKQSFPKDNLGLNRKPEGLEERSPFDEQADLTSQQPIAPTSPIGEDHPLSKLSSTTPSSARNTDLELVNSKLDTIKALLNSVDQRLSNLERQSGVKKERLW